MGSKNVLSGQILIFKFFGLWPSVNPKFYHYLHTAIAFYLLSIGFIVSLGISIAFVKSIKQAIDNLIVSSSVILAFIKGINVYFNKTKLIKLFEMLKQVDDQCSCENEIKKLQKMYLDSKILFNLFLSTYITAWIVLAFQSMWASKDKVFWSSTALYPHEINQNKIVYWLLLMFQGFANFLLVILVAATDTYGVILNHILDGHIDVLASRLEALGSDKYAHLEQSFGKMQKRMCDFALENCVRTYFTCLRLEITYPIGWIPMSWILLILCAYFFLLYGF